jgi:hypothetical protein
MIDEDEEDASSEESFKNHCGYGQCYYTPTGVQVALNKAA